MNEAVSALVTGDADQTRKENVIATLTRFIPAHLLAMLTQQGHRAFVLAQKQRYDEASPALRRLGVDVDGWPSPPAGLFVVEERTVYLRSTSPMTVVHEHGHSIDCALGGGVYKSSIDPVLRRIFAEATAFVTPYAATGTDELFAEGFRALCEANDPASFWPRATRARLKRLTPTLYDYLTPLFDARNAMTITAA